MQKRISVFILLLLFQLPLSVMAINNENLVRIFNHKERQIPGFPGIPGVPGTAEPQFPQGRSLICYVPYRVDVLDPKAGVIGIILIKQLKVELPEQPTSHWRAVEILTQGRKQLWTHWEKFRKDLQNNDIRIFPEISDSRDLLKEISRKEMWTKDQKVKWWQQINIGEPSNGGDSYPVDFPYSDKSTVVGSVVRYEIQTFCPIYDMENDDSNKYWEFVTDYIRKYAIATPDWDNPANDKDIPPWQFFYDEVNYE